MLQHQAAALHTESLEHEADGSALDKASLAEAWLVMEFCNRGTMRVCACPPAYKLLHKHSVCTNTFPLLSCSHFLVILRT